MFTPALPTAEINYKGYQYSVNGELPKRNSEPGRYFYIIKCKGRKPVGSEAEYGMITAASTAARAAIDTFAGAKG